MPRPYYSTVLGFRPFPLGRIDPCALPLNVWFFRCLQGGDPFDVVMLNDRKYYLCYAMVLMILSYEKGGFIVPVADGRNLSGDIYPADS